MDTVETSTESRHLGRLPLKTTRKALLFSDFFSFVSLPKATNYWTRKKPLPLRTFGNDRVGCCTRAKQAYAAMHMERIETKRAIDITDEEIIRVYTDMSNRLYGGADNGAFEDDALNEWRKPDLTFHDIKGHPLTIDAYLRINAQNPQELKAALALSGAKGIAVCLNIPLAFQDIHNWDVPEGQTLTGKWLPGSWGGHSMWAFDYSAQGVMVDDTWAEGPRLITWNAVAAYLDEAHLVIDSIDAWRKQVLAVVKNQSKRGAEQMANKVLDAVKDAVNAVSSVKIA